MNFFLLLPTDDTKNTNLFSLSPDEPDEPDGWRNVLLLPTDYTKNTNLFLRSFAYSVVCFSLSGSSGSSGDYT